MSPGGRSTSVVGTTWPHEIGKLQVKLRTLEVQRSLCTGDDRQNISNQIRSLLQRLEVAKSTAMSAGVAA